MVWDWYSHHTLPIAGKCDIVTCRDSKEAQSSWASRGRLMGQSACSGGVEPDSSTHKRAKPGGASGLHLGARASSSDGAASSGSDAVNSLGAGALTGGSTLVVSDGALPLEAGATGSLIVTSYISRSTRLPLSIMEVRHLWSSCIALQSIPRGILE